MLFLKDLSTFLINEVGFIPNPYDWCVINKVINGDQCTIGWHVDDLKISHVDEVTVEHSEGDWKQVWKRGTTGSTSWAHTGVSGNGH